MNLLVEFCETQRKKISQWQRYPIHYGYYTNIHDVRVANHFTHESMLFKYEYKMCLDSAGKDICGVMSGKNDKEASIYGIGTGLTYTSEGKTFYREIESDRDFVTLLNDMYLILGIEEADNENGHG